MQWRSKKKKSRKEDRMEEGTNHLCNKANKIGYRLVVIGDNWAIFNERQTNSGFEVFFPAQMSYCPWCGIKIDKVE